MSGTKSSYPFAPDTYDAVLFDLDGVLTDTAKVHATSWKKCLTNILCNME